MIKALDILNANILIVDDRQVNVRLLERALRAAGYTSVSSTMDSQEVCKLHRENNYDLILLDLEMPGMDGFEVIEGLKAIECGGNLPVFVITAHSEYKLRTLKNGVKEFVSKPFELVELLVRIQNMIEARLLYREAKTHTDLLEQALKEVEESRHLGTSL